jgi:hypothetical protein
MGGPGSGRRKGGISRSNLIKKESRRMGEKVTTRGTRMAKSLTTSKQYKKDKLVMKQLKRSK